MNRDYLAREAVELKRLRNKFPLMRYSQPLILKHEPNVRYVFLGRLPIEQQRQRWKEIQREDPAYADLLRNDSIVKELRETFAAEVFEKVPVK